jgi:hypothetical protein
MELLFVISNKQGFSTFSGLGATFTICYRLAGHKFINENNVLKRNDNLLKLLLN